jgi:hypothetical protein
VVFALYFLASCTRLLIVPSTFEQFLTAAAIRMSCFAYAHCVSHQTKQTLAARAVHLHCTAVTHTECVPSFLRLHSASWFES